MNNELPRRIAYRYAEVAEEFQVHRDTVRRWARTGKIRTVTIGGTPLIPATELERLLQPDGTDDGAAA